MSEKPNRVWEGVSQVSGAGGELEWWTGGVEERGGGGGGDDDGVGGVDKEYDQPMKEDWPASSGPPHCTKATLKCDSTCSNAMVNEPRRKSGKSFHAHLPHPIASDNISSANRA